MITLGNVTLDPATVDVRERLEEVGGSDERRIYLAGLLAGLSTVDEIEAALDAILNAASVDDYGASLSLRAGRRFWVRREQFQRRVSSATLTGAFELELRARDPFEESLDETTIPWSIGASGDAVLLDTAGNVHALPRITFIAQGDVANPSFGDGVRTLEYTGVVADGATLVFDSAQCTVTVNGVDVLPYAQGEFPRIEPGGTALVFTADGSGAESGDAAVVFHDRWW